MTRQSLFRLSSGWTTPSSGLGLCLASLHPRILSGEIDSLTGLGRVLRRRGHKVRLVTPFAADDLLLHPLSRLDSGPQPLLQGAVRMLQTIPRVIASSHEAELLHLALPTPAFSLVADFVQARTSVPVVVTFEGHLAPARQVLRWPHFLRDWKGSLLLWGVNNGLFGRMSLHHCPAYVVSTDYQRSELKAIGVPVDRIFVIPNVADGAKLHPSKVPSTRADLGLPSDLPVVGYIGHFNYVKGVDVLAQAFRELARLHPKAHLALAWSGQGDTRRVRRALVGLEERVHWLGKVDVAEFLSAVDVLALPYRSTAGQAAIPTLIIEALAMQRPLVTSRLPLIEEVIKDEHTGLLSPPEDPVALAAQLARLLSNPRLVTHLAVEQKAAAARFAPEALAVQYEMLYRSLLPQNRSYRLVETAAA